MNQRFDSRGHHAITTKPGQIDGRIQQLQGFCKICAMKVTAWFARTYENMQRSGLRAPV
jgi:hypothetical protein